MKHTWVKVKYLPATIYTSTYESICASNLIGMRLASVLLRAIGKKIKRKKKTEHYHF